jgi:hypothetical protein
MRGAALNSKEERADHYLHQLSGHRASISAAPAAIGIIAGFKSATTKRINEHRHTSFNWRAG